MHCLVNVMLSGRGFCDWGVLSSLVCVCAWSRNVNNEAA
jgi:hypothetical protein